MRYVVLAFCVFATACAGTAPTVPTSSLSPIGGGATVKAKGGSDLPFKGDLQATESVNGQKHTLSGGGNGTHLGRFTYTADIIVDPATGNGVGTVVWTAANGDQILASTAGQRLFVAFPTVGLKETQTITGGTGRFVDASGTIVVERSLDIPTHVTTGSFDGSINFGH